MIYLAIIIFEYILLYFLSRGLISRLFFFFRKIFRNDTTTIFIFSLFFLPGTIIHEMAHFLMALVLLVPVGKLNFIPEREDDGIRMGSVAIAETDFVRRFFVGVAPFIVGNAIIVAILYYFIESRDFTFLPIFFVGYMIFQISNTMFSSRRDMEGTVEFVVIAAILAPIFYYLNINYFHLSLDLSRFTEILKYYSLFLLIPIAINFVALRIIRFAPR